MVLGASPKPERYSNRAVRKLLQHGHSVVPVHPTAETIEGLPVINSLEKVKGPVDTITVYVSESTLSLPGKAFSDLQPGRVIFNPGAENEELKDFLTEKGIPVEYSCTLVMLSTNQF